MKKILLVCVAFLFIGCATGNKAFQETQKQMKQNLERTEQELLIAKSEVNELRSVLINVDAGLVNMNDLLKDLENVKDNMRQYWDQVVVPYMRNQKTEITELKRLLDEARNLEHEGEPRP